MPEILLNNRSCNIDVSNYRTVEEIIPSLKEHYLKNKEQLTAIEINNESFNALNSEEIKEADLSQITTINFKTTKKLSITQEAITYLPDFLDGLIKNIKNETSHFLKNNDINQLKLSPIIDKVDIFIQLITQIHKNSCFDGEQVLKTGLTIKQLEVHLLSVIKAINSALKNNDSIMLIDLLDHELIDNLTQWKISAIPQIKRIFSI